MPDPRRDEAGLSALAKFLGKPRTIEEIRERFELSERCAYRWMDYLKAKGADIVVRHEGKRVTFGVQS
jgi:predicted DNA-binding transcriptional regulator YafY